MTGIRSFTVSYSLLVNRIQTEVVVSKAFNPQTEKPHAFRKYKALWDTGATASVISKQVAIQAELIPIDIIDVHTAGGIILSPIYLVNIGLPNNVGYAHIKVTEGDLGNNDILIGMDIIGTGDFAISSAGKTTTFSFRTPSIEKIDFVKKDNPEIGRNNKCPCGSKKKYKHCCGKL